MLGGKNMKKFKLIGLIGITFMSLLFVTGCGNKNIEGSLEDIMAKVYTDIPQEERPMMLMNTEVTDENIEYYLGTKDIEYEEALASESGVGSIAHSVVLVRTKKNADIEDIKTKIKENINPRKWVCVGVEEDKVIVENKGNLIILIMVEDENSRERLEEAFEKLK